MLSRSPFLFLGSLDIWDWSFGFWYTSGFCFCFLGSWCKAGFDLRLFWYLSALRLRCLLWVFLESNWLYMLSLCCSCLLFFSNQTVLCLYRMVCCWSLIDSIPVGLSDKTVVVRIARGCTVSTLDSVFTVFPSMSVSSTLEALSYLTVFIEYFILVLSIS
jgi:hypothetical protein